MELSDMVQKEPCNTFCGDSRVSRNKVRTTSLKTTKCTITVSSFGN